MPWPSRFALRAKCLPRSWANKFARASRLTHLSFLRRAISAAGKNVIQGVLRTARAGRAIF